MTDTPFDRFAVEYDRWFDLHPYAYESELAAVRDLIPSKGLGVEVGAGTGRFASPSPITIGVEPSESMAAIACSRGITVHRARAEDLPFQSEHFDFVLMVTTLCFVDDPIAALKEVYRVLKPAGSFILAFIDKTTQLGRVYEAMKSTDRFYRSATFYSTQQVIDLSHKGGFIESEIKQTIFSDPDSMTTPDPVREGFGEGAFVVIHSVKIPRKPNEHSYSD